MKIVYLHQYFEKDKGGTRSYEIAKKLVSEGHQVTLITGNDVASCDGITIISTKTPYHQEYGYIRRIISFFMYMLKSFFYAIREKNVDMIYATSTPLTVGLVGKWVARIKKCEFVFEVRDLWPDVPIKLGIIKNKLLIATLYRMEYGIYKQADKIIALSDGMKADIVEKGIDARHIEVITNFADINRFKEISVTDQIALYTKYPQLQNRFISLYAGTIGFVNHIDYILKLAQNTTDEKILYVIVGDGKEKANLLKEAKRAALTNVLFLDAVSKADALTLMTMSDVGMCFVRDEEILNRNSQNKLFDFWAAGKPTLINYKGWQDEVMRKFKAGQGFCYENLDGLTAYLEDLSSHKQNYQMVQQYVNELANQYKKEDLLEKLSDILQNTRRERTTIS
ncbi:glycosyltransferase family 4 protein [Listeria grandensis]|uniref:glycosyltransferase family 4 protein n=1 Tax=Listeria grandensis TaxID=1494963 RepID=UPI00164DD592|nr:glycosyltransferase family 4 protein [Listeria grandensis]MBC6314415.1 glycosyltransferase family 4 protein [Listeria grandensis]